MSQFCALAEWEQSQLLPVFATVGFREKPFRPIPIDDLTDILDAAVNGRMPRQTVAVVGAEQLLLSEGRAVRGIRRRTSGRRGAVTGVGAARAHARDRVDHEGAALREGPGAHARRGRDGCRAARGIRTRRPATAARMFTDEQIRSALPEPGGFGWRDVHISR